MFKAIVSKNMIEVTQTEPITSGSVNAYLVEFEFSDEWVDLERIAVFQTSGDPVNVLLDDTNICFIPWEVMTEFGGRIRFGVYGTAGTEIVLPTAWTETDVVIEGVFTGYPGEDPTPSLISQLVEKIKELSGSGGPYVFGHGLTTEELPDGTTNVEVNVVDDFLGDNTLPISAAAVQSMVGGIGLVLETI